MADQSKVEDKKVKRTLTDEDIVETTHDRRSAVELLGIPVQPNVSMPGEPEGHTDADG